ATGAASLGAGLVHYSQGEARRLAATLHREPVAEWGSWADRVWDAFVPRVSFTVLRNQELLPFFYRLGKDPIHAWLLHRDGDPEGWFALANTRMHANPYFGNLQVATLTDCVGSESAIRAGCLLAIDAARELGADLLITNQQHSILQAGCAVAG